MKMNMFFKPHLTMPHGSAAEMMIWSGQTLLALIFGMAGYLKAFGAMEDLGMSMPWTSEVPEYLVRFIGVSELLGAIGVMLPSLTRIQPRLTVAAAGGLATVMILAMFFHLSRGEYAYMPVPMVLGCLAGTVAWARGLYSPIAPRDSA